MFKEDEDEKEVKEEETEGEEKENFVLHVVDQKSKNLVENEPSTVGEPQVKHLRERVSRIVVSL